MNYKEFSNKIMKRGSTTLAKVRGSMGVYDFYKAIRKNKWFDIGRSLTEKEYYSIIRGVNKLLAEEIAKGNTIVFPSRMGRLELRKLKRGVSIIDGKLKNTFPIDWENTIKLWYEDEEAKNNKTIVRHEEDYFYRVKYCKEEANYENQCFYEFTLNRFIRIALKDNIKNKQVDTLW